MTSADGGDIGSFSKLEGCSAQLEERTPAEVADIQGFT